MKIWSYRRGKEQEQFWSLRDGGRSGFRCFGSRNPPRGTLCMSYPCTDLPSCYQFVNGKYGELGGGKVKIRNLILEEAGLMLRGGVFSSGLCISDYFKYLYISVDGKTSLLITLPFPLCLDFSLPLDLFVVLFPHCHFSFPSSQ